MAYEHTESTAPTEAAGISTRAVLKDVVSGLERRIEKIREIDRAVWADQPEKFGAT
jgi:hypothetical protein